MRSISEKENQKKRKNKHLMFTNLFLKNMFFMG